MMNARRASVAPRRQRVASDAIDALAAGRSSDPFALLGLHPHGKAWVARLMAPHADEASVLIHGDAEVKAERIADGVFEARLPVKPEAYRWRVERDGHAKTFVDPYVFGPLLQESDLEAFRDGRLLRPASVLGAHRTEISGTSGVRFAVWAPNASRVSVVGDFNQWDGRCHPMRLRHTAGVWELFIPEVIVGAVYKFELLDSHGRLLPLKADPFARRTERPPASASLVSSDEPLLWHDANWIESRLEHAAFRSPMSIYEVHAPSWHHDEHGWLDWYGLAATLVPYVQNQGFTHIELLPVSEHPFGGSWGYQPVGLYAPTARLGPPEGFAHFVDSCHVAGIGVIVDWVSAHFPDDAHGLRQFDGTALYEHADPREGFHQDWQTSIYNYGRNEVRSYLIGSALDWIERFHIDGLRVDAVASMLYRDYSRAPGEWIPNAHGGRENLEAVSFIRELNGTILREAPGVMVIAEESTAWPGVSAPVAEGGLGFSHKWNMGWMHDTLGFMQRDPIYRKYHTQDLTFGLTYAWTERFILPLSHDEVVHGKGSLISRMPGDRWRQFANLRAYFGFMWGHPGKKLLFMGGEFAQWREWNHDEPLHWHLLGEPAHRGVFELVADLNRLLHEEPALYRNDHQPHGFHWLFFDAERSIYAFLRKADDASPLLVICNFTPEPQLGYRVGVPQAGKWREICNTDSAFYGGSNVGNAGGAHTEDVEAHGHGQSLHLVLPPLSTIFLRPELP